MVAARSGPRPVQAESSSEPTKRDPSSLATALTIRAENALNKAEQMQPGSERGAAMKAAKILANAAELLRHFSRTVGLPVK
ncbi:hypothetical protein S58_56960 [Bradyrhizobium oligotrophicum S58]|uniref:Uncharacterized protein n=1 Tax=Bradyrhizobium oligotrophicum S58 TaxID=1245469 RepID=M4ZCW8_9BRAD|nr:hypothetical protein [Bradyrhizobium oligotrophicum]BAM91673.1 hypothetical protein S58_56960 [Bradyrhizobium oligotrophicum S58]